MNDGKRHRQGPARGRALFASMSVIALLALACFPVFAQAECVSSSCVQYTESIPKPEGEHKPAQHKQSPLAKAADNGGASAPTKNSTDGSNGGVDESAEEESSSKEGGGAGSGNGGDTGQGNPGGSANAKGQNPVQQTDQTKGTSTSQSSDGGSSPLVPILIGIAVLAAISVGVVMYRQRRGPTASAPSPKAS